MNFTQLACLNRINFFTAEMNSVCTRLDYDSDFTRDFDCAIPLFALVIHVNPQNALQASRASGTCYLSHPQEGSHSLNLDWIRTSQHWNLKIYQFIYRRYIKTLCLLLETHSSLGTSECVCVCVCAHVNWMCSKFIMGYFYDSHESTMWRIHNCFAITRGNNQCIWHG